MSAHERQGLSLELFSPPPDPPGVEAHGGLKLDWRSDVGRMGMLLDWWSAVPEADAGVPADVARVLATGLCTVSTVTGCTRDVPDRAESAWTPIIDGRAHACWLGGPWWQRRRDVGLVASRDPSVVVRLFDDATFDWSQESQVLLLSPPGTLPRVDRELVEGCFPVPIRTTRAALVGAGVIALLRSGVDGALAGLYVLAPEYLVPLVNALRDAVVNAGGRWAEYPGAEHWSARSGGTPGASTGASS